MTKYLAGVLTVIAVGVLAVAYGLIAPGRTMNAAGVMPLASQYQGVDPMTARPVNLQQPVAQAAPYGASYAPVAVPVSYAQPAQVVTYVPAAQPTYVQPTYAQPVYTQPVSQARPVETVSYEPVRRVRTSERRVSERAPRTDWKRTAMIIGGSTAAGAGVGGIFGGRKGALIGAAIAGGASTIFQTTKQD